ncbi:hypothetical protein DICVIV_10751 [Dictyocaulus viviparus]|uniref:Uncharacterized protein n=1 Tax=Dictyocaulus viviparus TaxID=29172 RepID=A0A0D8XF28_DICVI|nr:hypothetical protein DICVIV_10751 [Dictyocaulus viviparus]
MLSYRDEPAGHKCVQMMAGRHERLVNKRSSGVQDVYLENLHNRNVAKLRSKRKNKKRHIVDVAMLIGLLFDFVQSKKRGGPSTMRVHREQLTSTSASA